MKVKKYCLSYLIGIIIISLFLYFPNFAFSTTCSLTWDMPSSFDVKDEDKDNYSDQTFVARVIVDNLNPPPPDSLIYAASLRITFDPNKLVAVDAEGYPIPEGGQLTPTPPYTQVLENRVYNSQGRIEYSAGTFTGQESPSEIVKINFKAKVVYGNASTSLTYTCANCSVLVNYEEEVTPPNLTCSSGSITLKDKIPPAIPAGLTIAPGNQSATLTWTANTEPDWASTKIYMAPAQDAENPPPADNAYTLQTTVNKPTVNYTKTGLTNNKYYWFKITALDSSGNESFYSYNAGTVSVTSGSPIVTGTDTKFLGNVYAGLRFMVVGDNKSYLIQSVDSNTQITLSSAYSGTTGTGKNYKIDQSSFVLVGEKKPNPPTNVQAVQPTPYNENKKIVITWTAPTQYTNGDPLTVSGYNIYRATGETDPYPSGYTKITTSPIPPTPTSYTDPTPPDPTKLSRGTKYWYRVTALDNANPPKESDKSSPGSCNYQDPPPAKPTGLTATSGVSKTVNLSWNANNEPDLAGYNIYQASSSCINCNGCQEPTTGWTKITSVDAQTTTYQKTGLTDGTVYFYKITAYDNGSIPTPGANESERSDAVCIKVPEDVPPDVLQATSVNATTVNVMFNEDLDSTSANNKDNYTIKKKSDQSPLSVTAAALQGDNKTVKLTTASQEYQVEYTLTVVNVKDKYNNPIPAPGDSVDFTGGMTDNQPPVVNTPPGVEPQRITRSVDNTTVAVELYDPPLDGGIDPTTANTKTNYSITPALSITAAQLQANGKTVHLTTAQQLNQTYTVKVTYVKDLNGNVIVNNNTTNVATFTGTPPEPDPPVLVDAVASPDGKSVMLTFTDASGELESTSANNKNNYSIPGLTISAAQLQTDKLKVKLTTSQMGSQTYTVTVVGVKDKWLNVIPAPGQSKDFQGPDTTPPKVVSANSPESNKVVVVFDEPVDKTTSETTTNYTFTPSLSVSGAVRGSSPDDNKVTLTVSDMKKQNYTVTVQKVKDLSGNVIGSNNTYTFLGTPPETDPPVLDTIEVLSGTSLMLTFTDASGELESTSANNKNNYSIPGLTISGAQLQTNKLKVKLTTSQMSAQPYTLTVVGVKDKWLNEIVEPQSKGFQGPDTTPPKVVSANSPESNKVVVVFDEPVDKTTSETTTNYTFTPSLSVSGAVRDPNNTVTLTVSDMKKQNYTVTVKNVTDLSGNPIGSNNTYTFLGTPPETDPPYPESAEATDSTHVNVVFNEELDSTSANNKSNYSINGGLSVSSAVLQADLKTVKLTTSTQTPDQEYTITITGVKDKWLNEITGPPNTVNFRGVATQDTDPPTVTGATVIDCQTVDVQFSEEVDSLTANNPANYTIQGLSVSSASLQANGFTVRLTTSSQSNTNYQVRVTNVKDLAGNTIVDNGQTNVANFTGIPCDTTPPSISSVTATSTTTVDIVFSESLDPTTATNTGNYTIDQGVIVSAASYNDSTTTVTLTTSELSAGVTYNLAVKNIKDLAGNTMPQTTRQFVGPDFEKPQVISAIAINNTTVEVVFSEPVEKTSAETVSNYTISPSLSITFAERQTDTTKVRLTTSSQTAGQNYTLTVQNVKDLAGNTVHPSYNTANFVGKSSDTVPPTVTGATVINCQTVDVQFSEEVDSLTANNPANYTIQGLNILSASLQENGFTVRLTTSSQSNTNYQVRVTNVKDLAGNTIVDNGQTNVANFTQIYCDTTPPSISSVTATSTTTVDIVFSESLDPDSANTLSNYTIDQNVSVLGVSYNNSNRTVTLTTSELSAGVTYNLTVQNIKDLAGNTMPQTTRQFVGPDFEKPQVISAIAIDNTTVEVVFSEPVEKTSAENKSNYSIAPVLTINSAQRQTDTTKVRLITSSQTAGQNYTLTVQNVKDLAGNTVDPNYNTATFTGKSSDTQPPVVQSAKSSYSKNENRFYVDVKFYDPPSDGPIDPVSASDISNYTITGLDVLSAILQADQKTVKLETSEQVEGQTYTLTVQNVKDIVGNVITGSNTANFKGADKTPPKVTSATATSSTSVEVTFSESVSSSATNVFCYIFEPSLEVKNVVFKTGTSNKVVIITTSTQEPDPENPTQGKTYTVTVVNVKDLSENEIEPPDNTATFVGIPGDTIPPKLISATSPSLNRVRIFFNEKMKESTIGNIGYYEISPYIQITRAELIDRWTDKKIVELTTSSQTEGTTYTITVSNVEDEAGNTIDPAHNSATFVSDHTPPQLSSAKATGNTEVEVVFNEEVEKTTAEDPRNYSTLPTLTISSAELQADRKIVLLTTSAQTVNQQYRLYVSNVTDINGNKIADNSSTTFYGVADIYYPQIESAVSTSCTELQVVFNKLVTKESAENKSNWKITTDIGSLNIESIELQSDEKTVTIKTSTQDSCKAYYVTAVNISDKETPPNVIPADGSAQGNSKSFLGYYWEGCEKCGDPPVITHTPITVAPPDTPITITCSITDNGMITKAELFYRKSTETPYSSTVMTQAGGNNYTGKIPGYPDKTTIYYYISATDDTNRTTREPKTGQHTISIKFAYGNLRGKVIQQDNSQPIKDVKIKVSNASNTFTTTTDTEGMYYIYDILVGSYTITAEKEGYIKVTQEFTISENETKTIDLQMATVPPPAIKSIKIVPNKVSLAPGRTKKFTCYAINELGREFAVTPEWELKVDEGSPQSELGTISSDGMFTATKLNPGVEKLTGKLIANYFVYTTPPKKLTAEASITISRELEISGVRVTDLTGQEIKYRPFSPKSEAGGIRFWFDVSQMSPTPAVEVNIYDMKGNLIRTVLGNSTEGYAEWDYKDASGRIVPNGVYIYQLVIRGAKVIYSKPKLIGIFK